MTNNYRVVYAKYKGNNFSGCAPDVPGCVSTGDTLEEMEAMMREALESHLGLLAERGYAIPEPAAASVDFKREDFDDTEYFVVRQLEVKVPARARTGASVRAA
jgi:predicted RNase H-like HicB family nuclease